MLGISAHKEDAVDATPPVEPPPSTEAIQTIQRRTWTRNIAIFVGSVLVLVGLGWGAGSLANRWATPESEKALAEIVGADDGQQQAAQSSGGPEATLSWSDERGLAVLAVKGMPELAPGYEYAAWYIRDEVPHHVGAFTTSVGAATVELDEVWQSGDVLQVTAEESAGLSGGAPTGEVVVSIDSDETGPADDEDSSG